MPYSKLRSLYVGLPALGLLGLLVASCGSSNGGSSGDAGDDISHKLPEVIVGDGGGDDGSLPAGSFDGTTGQPCTKDSDCAAPGGPGVNVCSSSLVEVVANVVVSPLPTPFCVMPPGSTGANCDPAPTSGQNADPTGMFFHYCDGPDDPSSPGVCIPLTNPTQTGLGTCQVLCTLTYDGSAALGCPGQDTCQIIPGAGQSDPNTGQLIGGLGYCRGACEKDADCADLNKARAAAGPDAGPPWVCQVDVGFCTQAPVTNRTKALGTACVPSGRGSDNTTGACNCGIVNTKTNKAYCTSACIVGGSVPCPDGWRCDDLQASQLPDGTTLATENMFSPGVCVPGCTLPAEGGAPEAGAPEAAAPEASTPTDASSEASGDAQVEASAPSEAGSSGGDASSSADSGQGSSSGCPATSTCKAETPNGPECLP